MRLTIDAVGNKHSGGATVLLQVLEAALLNDHIEHVTLLASPAGLRRFGIEPNEKLHVEDVAAESARGRLLWALRRQARRMREADADALVGLNGIASAHATAATLVMIQQSTPYCHEALQCCPRAARFRMRVIWWVARRSARAVDHVIVQSEVMREYIVRAYGLPRRNISVFLPTAPRLPQPSIGSRKLEALRARPATGAVLYVGNEEPYKNLPLVAEALRRLPEARRPRFYVTLHPSAPLCREGAATGLGVLDGPELHEAYLNATLLILPSLTESVGLPLLEAMRVGTPVLAADRPYAHAICENAAAFFDPHSPDDLASKVEALHTDQAWRRDLIERGHALVRRRDGQNPYKAMVDRIAEVTEQVKLRNARGNPLSKIRRTKNQAEC